MDEQAFEFLFRSHFKGLCQFAYGYVKDYEGAREIVQDSFVSLWMKRDSIDLSKPVKTYLSTTVRNKCLNYLRDNRKFSGELLALENLSESATYEQPDKLIERDIREQIDAAINELPEKCREVFILNRFKNLKYQQIAEKLGISVKTVESQMSKALRHLRIRLAEYFPFVLVFLISVH
ncbi:MAG: RNA polymerase sigma-70 factor [Bacteroidetes bacterium]|nr:RNA polymerase sigma-70 factor [Bacteroidota bacterium]